MAASFIRAQVIETNNSVFFNEDGTLGQLENIPTPGNGGVIDGDFWAVPITDGVVGTGFNYVPTEPDSTDKPDIQAFHVVKISMRNSSDWWYLLGVSNGTTAGNYGYVQASQDAECCDDTPRTMPTDVPHLVACQFMCSTNAAGNYVAYFGLPTLTTALPRYYPKGYLNGAALTSASNLGYASINSLISFLNTNWNVGGGSPASSIVWTYTVDGLTLIATETGGDGNDYICAGVIGVSASGI